MKEPLTEVTKVAEPEAVVVPTTPPPANTNPNPNEPAAADEKEEKRSNGAHTPV